MQIVIGTTAALKSAFLGAHFFVFNVILNAMNLRDFFYLKEGDVDGLTAGQEVVTVRTPWLYHLVWYGIFLIVFWSCVGVYAGYHYHEMFPPSVPSFVTEWFEDLSGEAPYLAIWIGFFMLIFVLMARAMFKKSLKKRGWRVKAMSKGIFIQFRPFMNQDFSPNDETVMFLPAALISGIREIRYWEKSGSNEYTYRKFVEFQVKRLEVEELKRRLQEEGERKTKVGSRWNMDTVKLGEDSAVHVDFSGVKPRSAAFVKAMERWYMTQEPVKLSMEEAREAPDAMERLREKMEKRRKKRNEKI